MSLSAAVKAMAAAAAVGVSGILVADSAAAPAMFPLPILSVSTVTIRAVPNRVAFLAQWVRRCVGTTCPTQYEVIAERRSVDGYTTEHAHVTTAVRDTVAIERGICADTGITRPDTISFRVVAHGRGAIEQSNAATSTFAVRCRPLTTTERAEDRALADSFPDHQIALGDWAYKIPAADLTRLRITQLRAAKTAAESTSITREFAVAATISDSLRTVTSALRDTLRIRMGLKTALCLIAKNRYTGRVEVLSGDVIACEGPRAAMQSRRAG